MSNQKQSTTQKDSAETKARIIEATARVFAEKGYEATTLREIARVADAAPGLVHYYFGGKDQLLVEVLEASGRRFNRETEEIVQQVSHDQSLEALLKRLYERVDQEPEVYRLRYESFSLGLHNPLIAPKVRERLAQRREEIGSVMAFVLASTEFTRDTKSSSLDVASLAAILLSIFDGLALQKIMDPSFEFDAAYQVLAQMLHRFLFPD